MWHYRQTFLLFCADNDTSCGTNPNLKKKTTATFFFNIKLQLKMSKYFHHMHMTLINKYILIYFITENVTALIY